MLWIIYAYLWFNIIYHFQKIWEINRSKHRNLKIYICCYLHCSLNIKYNIDAEVKITRRAMIFMDIKYIPDYESLRCGGKMAPNIREQDFISRINRNRGIANIKTHCTRYAYVMILQKILVHAWDLLLRGTIRKIRSNSSKIPRLDTYRACSCENRNLWERQ